MIDTCCRMWIQVSQIPYERIWEAPNFLNCGQSLHLTILDQGRLSGHPEKKKEKNAGKDN